MIPWFLYEDNVRKIQFSKSRFKISHKNSDEKAKQYRRFSFLEYRLWKEPPFRRLRLCVWSFFWKQNRHNLKADRGWLEGTSIENWNVILLYRHTNEKDQKARTIRHELVILSCLGRACFLGRRSFFVPHASSFTDSPCVLFSFPPFFQIIPWKERIYCAPTALFPLLNIKRGIHRWKYRMREKDARYLSHPRRIVEPSTERGVGRTMPSCVTTPGRLPVNAATWRIIIVVCTSFSCPSLGTLIFFGLNWCADNCAWVPRNGRSFSREIVAWLIPFYTYRWKGRWRWIRKHARTRVQWGWRLIRCQWAAQSAIMYSFWRDPVPFVVRT